MRKDYIASSFRLVADVLRIGFGDEVGLGFDIYSWFTPMAYGVYSSWSMNFPLYPPRNSALVSLPKRHHQL